jgi:hypothetical protein
MSTAIIKDFVTNNGLEVEESITLGDKTVTSLVDSSTVNTIVTSPSVAATIVVAGGATSKTYDSADLLPLSGNTAGEMAFVNTTNRLYLWNGSGWYNIALLNTSPSLTTTPDSNYTLDSNGGTAVTVTMVASDPEEVPITYSYLSDSASNFVTITQDSGVFTLTTLTQAQLDSNGVGSGGTFSITFRASDGVNIAPAVSSFTLAFAVTYDWTSASEQEHVVPSTRVASANFGSSVSLSEDGNYAAIGSENFSGGGAAHIFTRSPTYYDVSAASYASKSYSFATQENSPTGFEFNSDGTKLIIVGWQQIISGSGTGGCYQYSLSTAYDVSTATYDSVSFNLGNEMVQPMGMKFSSDGTKMFVIDNQAGGVGTGDVVFQYNLSTAYDISSASYSNNSLNVNSYETVLGAIDFKPDGTKMFLLGAGSDTVRAWDLSSAWDLSTASYASETYNVGSQVGSCSGLTFNGTGTKMFITGYQNDFIHQYSLSTAWDVSSASYDSVSLSVSSQESEPRQLRFNSDGSKLWLIGNGTDSIYQYNTVSNWQQQAQITHSTRASGDSFGVSIAINKTGDEVVVGASGDDDRGSQSGTAWIFTRSGSTWTEQQKLLPDDTPSGASFGIQVAMNYNGDTIAITSSQDNITQTESGAVYIYTKSGGTWSQQAKIKADTPINGESLGNGGLSLSDDGNTLIAGCPNVDDQASNQGAIYIFTRSGSTWSQEQRIYDSSGVASQFFGRGVSISGDGTIAAIGARGDDNNQGAVFIYTASSSPAGYDIANASHDTALTITGHGQSVSDHACLDFSSDGTKMYVGGFSGDLILQYNLTTAFDVSTASYVSGNNLDVSSETGYPTAIKFKSDGTKLYVVNSTVIDGGTETIFQYGLSTAWDLSTASYDSVSVDLRTYATRANGIDFKPDGTKMFIVGAVDDAVDEFSLSTAWDLSTLTHQNVFSVSSQEALPTGIAFNDDGTKMFISGYVGQAIFKYNLTTAYDVSTASYSNESLDVSSQTSQARNIVFNNDGTKLFLAETVGEQVEVYNTQGPTWSQQAKLNDDTTGPGTDDKFGDAGVWLSGDGTILAAGSPEDNTGGTNHGSVTVFSGSGATWTQQIKLTGSNVSNNSYTGRVVRISHDASTLILGAPLDDDGATTDVGAAYVFTAPQA